MLKEGIGQLYMPVKNRQVLFFFNYYFRQTVSVYTTVMVEFVFVKGKEFLKIMLWRETDNVAEVWWYRVNYTTLSWANLLSFMAEQHFVDEVVNPYTFVLFFTDMGPIISARLHTACITRFFFASNTLNTTVPIKYSGLESHIASLRSDREGREKQTLSAADFVRAWGRMETNLCTGSDNYFAQRDVELLPTQAPPVGTLDIGISAFNVFNGLTF